MKHIHYCSHILHCSHILLLAGALLLSACGDEGLGADWVPSLSPRQLGLSSYDAKMSAYGGTSTVSVTALGARWRFDGADPSWLTLSPKSGGGDATVTLTAQPNLDATTGRSVAYAFVGDDAAWDFHRQFSVSQDAAGYFIRPAATSFTKSAEEQQFEIGVASNEAWTAKSDQPWLTPSATASALIIKLSANTTSPTADRIAHVTLSAANATEVITVNQQPPSVTVAQDELVYGPDAESKPLEVKSDVPWSAACSQPWVTLSPEEGGAGSTPMQVRAAENASVSERTANVYIQIGSERLRSIPVRQQGMAVTTDVSTLPAFSPEGGSQTLTVTSNTSWSVLHTPSFVTVSPTEGAKGATSVTVTATANSSVKSLSDDILIGRAGVTGLQAKVHVEQDCVAFGLSEQTVTVGSTAGSRHELSLSSDQSWTASFQSGTWAHVSPASGTGSATLTLTADDNPSTKEREDILTITPAVTKTPLTFRFVQQGKTLEVSTTELTVTSGGGTSAPLVITTDGTFSVTKQGDWFTIAQDGKTVTVSAEANTGTTPRTGTVTVSLTNLSAGESLSRTVTVRQAPGGIISGDGFGEDKDWSLHEYVDLGLRSGLKWATMNVGATSPEDYGEYFAWGETKPKSTYNWSTYKWCNGSNDSMTKYCKDSKYGQVDNKATLDPEDDVAHVNWGGSWRMPTKAEIEELRDNCTWTWTTQNGVKGRKVIGPNGNSLFLPAAGSRLGGHLYYAGSNGGYWSSSLGESYSNYAYYLDFGSGDVSWYDYYRSYGFSVRPVCQ